MKGVSKQGIYNDVLTFSDHVDVPIAKVFESLKKDLVVVEKPSFSWDEDSKVRDMLHAVFHEEEDDDSSNVQSGGPV